MMNHTLIVAVPALFMDPFSAYTHVTTFQPEVRSFLQLWYAAAGPWRREPPKPLCQYVTLCRLVSKCF